MSDLIISALEKDAELFTEDGLDIRDYIERKSGTKHAVNDFTHYHGEYYLKPHKCKIGDENVFFKSMDFGQIYAEILLSRIYNKLGMETPIAYPWMDEADIPIYARSKQFYRMPAGVVTRDVHDKYPTAKHLYYKDLHTIQGLYKKIEELPVDKSIRIAKLKELIMSLAFNNKDAGYSNSFWAKTGDIDGKYDTFIPIDLGYSGRDSMYLGKTKEETLKLMYMCGEHGYNGFGLVEEDRATIMNYLRRLLAGESVDGVKFDDRDIIVLRHLLKEISKIDFKKEAQDIQDHINWTTHPKLIDGLEISRADTIEELSK